MKKKIKCAVVGVGYLGKFHAEKYVSLNDAELVGVHDLDQGRSQEIAAKLRVDSFVDYRDMLGKIDAVSIAATTSSHYSIAKFFLENGIHTLLEKPITTNLDEASELLNIAKEKKLILQIGHLERFNPVFTAVKPLIKNPIFIEAERLASFKARGTDVDVILDLMIHDIDLILNLVDSPLKQIRAHGYPTLSDKIDLVKAYFEFENGCGANLTASRISLKTKRKMRIFLLDSYFSCDFGDKTLTTFSKEKSKLPPYLPEITSQKQHLEANDPLYTEIESFINSITRGVKPIVTAYDAKKAVAVALEIRKIAEENLKLFI